jgi:hypothetical protein
MPSNSASLVESTDHLDIYICASFLPDKHAIHNKVESSHQKYLSGERGVQQSRWAHQNADERLSSIREGGQKGKGS